MASMRIGLHNFGSFNSKPKGTTFEGTVSLPTVITAPVRINSATLHMKNVRIENDKCYLSFGCGTTTGWTGVFKDADGAAVMREVGMTFNEPHGNILAQDGRKIAFTIQSTNASWSGNFFGIYNVLEFWIDIDYTILESASTLGLSTTALDAGGTVTATIGAGVGAASHKLVWQFGTRTSTATLGSGVLSSAFAIPLPWLDQIPNAPSGIASCTMTTYNAAGAQIGSSVTAYFSISCPASVVPTIGSFVAEGINQSWSLYLQGRSQVKVTASGAAGAHGSTIASYFISGGGFSAAANTLTTGVLNAAGGITFTVTVTDSRGRTASRTVSITVTAYSAPRILSTSEQRCDAAGNVSRSGLYARCVVTYDYSVVGSNGVMLNVDYKRADLSTWTSGYWGVPASGSPLVIGGGLDGAFSWDIRYILSDSLQNITVQKRVGTAKVLMHLRPGGKGIGIGGMCEADNTLQIADDWSIRYNGSDVSVDGFLPSPTDLNNVKKSGQYRISLITNGPSWFDASWGQLIVSNGKGGDTTLQIVSAWFASRIAVRTGGSGNSDYWAPWQEVLTDRTPVTIAQGGTGANWAAGAQPNLKLTKSFIFSQTNTSADISYSGITSYPTEPGIYRIISQVSGMPSDAGGYGCLVIFNSGYGMHLYSDGTALWIGRTTDAIKAPTSWLKFTGTTVNARA